MYGNLKMHKFHLGCKQTACVLPGNMLLLSGMDMHPPDIELPGSVSDINWTVKEM